MKRTKAKVMVSVIAAGVLLTGTVTANANSISSSLRGIPFTAVTSITASSAIAQTVSGSPKLSMSVEATYGYLYVDIHKGYTVKKSASGTMSAAVNFSVPDAERYESIDVSAKHAVVVEGTDASWTESTYEKYK